MAHVTTYRKRTTYRNASGVRSTDIEYRGTYWLAKSRKLLSSLGLKKQGGKLSIPVPCEQKSWGASAVWQELRLLRGHGNYQKAWPRRGRAQGRHITIHLSFYPSISWGQLRSHWPYSTKSWREGSQGDRIIKFCLLGLKGQKRI